MKTPEQNESPIGWYVGSYLLRFIELESGDNENPDKKFLSWENTIIVQAENFKEAYEKVVYFGRQETEPYKGGQSGVSVQWAFEGVTELLPIYEPLADGSEIMWGEHKPRKLKNLRAMVKEFQELE